MRFSKYICKACGFIYDEEKGIPEEGILPGTLWKDFPEAWECPDCGVRKQDFVLLTKSIN